MKSFIRQTFLNQWIGKKSRQLITHNGQLVGSVFYCSLIHFDNEECLLFDSISRQYRLRVRNKISSIEEIYENLSLDEALKYQNLWLDSNLISPGLPTERVHLREDGQPKRQFRVDNFGPALYSLKRKYPTKNCMAYVCADCGAIHLGKYEF